MKGASPQSLPTRMWIRRKSCSQQQGRLPMTTTSEHVKGTRTPPRWSGNRLVGLVSRVRELGLLVVLLLIVIVVGVQVPEFFTISNIVQILLSVSIIAIVAV